MTTVNIYASIVNDGEAEGNGKVAKIAVDINADMGMIDCIRSLTPIPEGCHIGTIELPSEYKGNGTCKTVKSIGSDILRRSYSSRIRKGYKIGHPHSPIDKLILPKSVTQVYTDSFYMAGVNTLVWPEACKEIPEKCFNKSFIRNFEGIENVEKIGSEAFSESSVEVFDWPAKATEIPNRCFFNCPRLTKINGVENVTTIGEGAFLCCNRLESFDWPEGCDEIPRWCFEDCQKLKTINIPGKLSAIGLRAFSGVVDLEEIDLSNSISCDIDSHFGSKHIKLIEPFYQ
jgi:hypothetical protein